MMMGEAGHVDWTCMTSAVPAFLTMVIQPFTFSIANGIYAGLAFRCGNVWNGVEVPHEGQLQC